MTTQTITEPTATEVSSSSTTRAFVAAVGAHLLVFGWVARTAVYRPDDFPGLYRTHIRFIPDTLDPPWDVVTFRSTWHSVARVTSLVVPGGEPKVGALVATLFAYGLIGAALVYILTRHADGSPLLPTAPAVVVSLGIALLETPTSFLGWERVRVPETRFLPLYLEFIPSATMSFGFNIFAVWMVAQLVEGRMAGRARALVPLTVVAAALAKPNLSVGLPAAAVAIGLGRGLFGRDRSWRPLRDALIWVAVPTGIVVGGMYYAIAEELPIESRGGIAIKPFLELRQLGGTTVGFWLVLLFPIVALVVLRRSVLEDARVQLCFLSVAVTGVATAVFARTGDTIYKGANGGDVLQMLQASLAVTVVYLIRRIVVLHQARRISPAALVVLGLALAPYLVAGLRTWTCHTGALSCYPVP